MFRVIAGVQFCDNRAVKTLNFKDPRYLGDVVNICKILEDQGVQEFLLNEIDVFKPSLTIPIVATRVAKHIRSPLTFGGGINSLEKAEAVIGAGFERILVSTKVIEVPSFVSKLVNEFGASSVSIGLDFTLIESKFQLLTSHRRLAVNDWQTIVKQIIEFCPGEIVLKIREFDGSYRELKTVIGEYSRLFEFLSKIVDLRDVQILAGCGINTTDAINQLCELELFDGVVVGSLISFAGSGQGVLVNFPREYQVIQKKR